MNRLSGAAYTALLALCYLPGALSAAVLEEIQVTAQKRAEGVQDVPFAITAVNGDDLDISGIDSLEEYAYLVPGLAISAQDNGRTQINIRGINSGEVRRDNSRAFETVGLYLDEIPLSLVLYNPNLDSFDFARVEVLRGPQGTLYGSGSLAGTIRMISNAPDMEEFSGRIDAGFESVSQGDTGYSVKGMLNAPIVEDVLAARIVAYMNETGGWIDNLAPGPYGGTDVNSGEKNGVRASLLWTPNDNIRIRPTYIHQETNNDGTAEDHFLAGTSDFVAAGLVADDFDPSGKHQQWVFNPQIYEDEMDIFNITAEFDVGDYTVTSSSSWTERDIKVTADATLIGGLALFFARGAIGQPILGILFDDLKSTESFSQELRISSNSSGPLQWIGGIFYSEQDLDYAQPLFATDPAALAVPIYAPFGVEVGMLNESSSVLDYEQQAVFGELSYDFSEEWSGTIGLRWFDVEQSFDTGGRGILTGAPVSNPTIESSEDGVNPKFLVSYTPTDDLLFSAQASQGFRLGGPQSFVPLVDSPGLQCQAILNDTGLDFDRNGYDSETLWNYELAMKSTLADGAVRFNASIFKINYEDLQITSAIADTTGQNRICGFSVTTNAGEATSQGLEMELVMQPTDDLTLSFSGAYIDTELEDDLPNGDATSGDELLFSPNWTFSAVAYYERPLTDMLAGYANVIYQHTGASEMFFPNSIQVQLGVADTSLDSYDTVNLRLGVKSEQWEASLFANNLFDEYTATYTQTLGVPGPAGGSGTNTVLQPRTVGVNMKYKF